MRGEYSRGYGPPEARKSPERMDPRELQERLLRTIVYERIIEDFQSDMEDMDIPDKYVEEFAVLLSGISKEDALRCLSIPKELRHRKLQILKQKCVQQRIPLRNVLAAWINEARTMGYSVGYHISPRLIEPIQTRDGAEHWEIKGYDLDDRDNMSMAYYSLDFENFYRKNPKAPYLYVVRAETGSQTTHRQDTSNRWGRAPSLSVITRLNLPQINEQIRQRINARNRKTGY